MAAKSIKLSLLFIALCVVNAEAQTSSQNKYPTSQAEQKKGLSQSQITREKDEILIRDQVDDSDIFAIPFDDSEVEDEQEINAIEKREAFALPQAR